MKLRAPAYPLITVDPYFSIWSRSDELNTCDTTHWTRPPHRLDGVIIIDQKRYCFMGKMDDIENIKQVSADFNAFSTVYVFENEQVQATVTFTSPLLLDDLYILSRPVSYIKTQSVSLDGKEHDVKFEITLNDEICQHTKFQFNTAAETKMLKNCIFAKVGSVYQKKMLKRSGDDLRIEWGYACLACNDKDGICEKVQYENEYGTKANDLRITAKSGSLFTVAYDDVKCIEYFGKQLTALWKKDGKTIEEAVDESFTDYDALIEKCNEFSDEIYSKATEKVNEKYAELLMLAYRQTVNAHKICADDEGNILFISKECFSNGCAATVDVTYPSIPLYLMYNTELVKGMLRPIFKYARSEEWIYDFAPHDAGRYPLLNGQFYSDGTDPKSQMPVEECGNMLIISAAISIIDKNTDFVKMNLPLLEKWCNYLLKNGMDPENQLCTDDFAGHLAHNCNLSIKAIMGIASFGIICKMMGNDDRYNELIKKAREMGREWEKLAANGDGSFRLAFDKEDTFSMKYNAVWDKLFKTEIFSKGIFDRENKIHIEKHMEKYGLPLDNRETYTKSDWLIWTATLCDNTEDFIKMSDTLWDAYNFTESRHPMTDWFRSKDAKVQAFINRSVQGGLFIKLLEDYDFSF